MTSAYSGIAGLDGASLAVETSRSIFIDLVCIMSDGSGGRCQFGFQRRRRDHCAPVFALVVIFPRLYPYSQPPNSDFPSSQSNRASRAGTYQSLPYLSSLSHIPNCSTQLLCSVEWHAVSNLPRWTRGRLKSKRRQCSCFSDSRCWNCQSRQTLS